VNSVFEVSTQEKVSSTESEDLGGHGILLAATPSVDDSNRDWVTPMLRTYITCRHSDVTLTEVSVLSPETQGLIIPNEATTHHIVSYHCVENTDATGKEFLLTST
jgi:hypothetical protein